jgi:Mn-dependent DtxR family transcriptional regulator
MSGKKKKKKQDYKVVRLTQAVNVSIPDTSASYSRMISEGALRYHKEQKGKPTKPGKELY